MTISTTYVSMPAISISNLKSGDSVRLTGPYERALPATFTVPGPPGKSAYEIAVQNGFTGTQAEWLSSLTVSASTAGRGYWTIKADSASTFPSRSTVPSWWTGAVQYDSTQYANHPDPADMIVGDQHLKRTS